MPISVRTLLVYLCGVAMHTGALVAPMTATAQTAMGLCGELYGPNRYGPFDYRTATPFQRNLVEGAHFTPSVETLRKGNSASIGGDINYTLHAFPNHLRALYAMTRLGEKLRTTKPPGARYPVECYYDRAIRFQPDDAGVRALYAIYLIDHKRDKEARDQLTRAEAGAETDPQLAYNLGLAYFDLKEYERSMKFASIAYSKGINVPGLRNKLEQAGKWHPLK